MQTEEFVNQVAETAAVSDLDDARAIGLATVECICMYLPAEQTRELAAQLPKEVAKAAEAGAQQHQTSTDHVELADFFHQVAVRADMADADVEPAARAAARVFKQALSRGESVDVVMDAPDDVNTLLVG